MPVSRPIPTPVSSYPTVGSYAIPEVDINYGRFAVVDNTAVIIHFSLYDLNNIKAQLIANSPSTSWLAIDQCALVDQNDQPVIPLVNRINTQMVTNFTEDRTAPILQSFTLDMNTGYLSLSFSETVNLATLRPSHLTLQSVANSSYTAAQSYTLLYTSMLGSGYATSLILPIDTLDLDQIKFRRSLVTTLNNTYLSITNLAIQDTESNFVIRIPTTNALRASNFTRDFTRPNLISFDLDMNFGSLTLTFDETVSADTFKPTSLVLEDDIYVSTTSYILTGGYFHIIDSTVISLNITDYDLNEIKKIKSLATLRYTTNLMFDSSLVNDTDGNMVNPSLIPVTVFTPDTTPPFLRSFAVNLTSETIHFVFSETVNSFTFNPTSLTLQESTSPFRRITLTLTSSLVQPVDSTDLVLLVETPALNYLKMHRDFFTNINNTFITFSNSLVQDMNGNDVIAITDGKKALSFYSDFVRPQLSFFNLDLTREILYLTFSETVDYASVSINELTLQQVKDHVGSSVEDWSLTGGQISSAYSTILTIQLTAYDLDNIKRIVELATSTSSTYLRLSYWFVRDMNNNSIVAIAESEGLLVTQYTRDSIDPYLVSFSLDLSQELITLSFSETVSQPSFQIRFLTFQSTANSDVYFITLTSYSSISQENSTLLTLQFDHDDLNVLKAITQIATSPNDTFLSHTSTLITDMSGNFITPILYTRAQQVESYIPDSVPIQLTEYNFDLNTGCLSLSFSETLNIYPTNLTSLVFQSFSNLTFAAYMGVVTSTLRLTGGNVTYIPLNPPRAITSCHFEPSDKIQICFNTDNFNTIKFDSILCQHNTSNDCFITFGTNAIVDSAGNQIIPIFPDEGLPPSVFIADRTGPKLYQFEIMDMDTGRIFLKFSEPLSHNTLLTLPADRIRLQRFYRNINLLSVTESLLLSSGTVMLGSTGLRVSITLTIDETNELKINDMLCTSNSNCWVSIISDTFFDPQYNGNVEVSVDNAIDAQIFTPDTTQPELISFDLDIDIGNLTLIFNEPIRSISFNPYQLYLFNAQYNYTKSYNLTSQSKVVPVNGLVQYITLSEYDISMIISIANLATSNSNTYLQLRYGGVTDMNGNKISDSQILQVRYFQQDMTPPRILEFSLDLITDTISFTFSEMVRLSSFNTESFSIIPAPRLSGVSLSLAPYTGSNEDSVITAYLSAEDILQLKLNHSLATTTFDTYLTAESNAVADIQGNYLVQIPSSSPLKASTVISDTNPSSVVSFVFDLNKGSITLTFNDVILSSTLTGSSLVLQDAATRTTSFRLSDSTYTNSTDGYVITIYLVLEDLNAIKANLFLATNLNNTYITVGADFVRDSNGQDIIAVSDDNGIRASFFYPDVTHPVLEGFSMDLDSGDLTLSFSETVQGHSLWISAITLHSSRSVNSTSYTLRPPSSPQSIYSPLVVVFLSAYDMDRIKLYTDLLTSNTNSYISLSNNSIQDMSGNTAVVIPYNKAIQINQLIPDTTSPALLAYDFDLDSGILMLNFSEAINDVTLVASGFTLQNSENSIYPRVTLLDDVTHEFYGYLGRDLHFKINVVDLNLIKYYASLATSTYNTFLTISPVAISDLADNQVEAVYNPFGIQVRNFVSDSTPPNLINFSLNLDLVVPQLTILFDETVDTSTLNVSQITLQSTALTSCNTSILNNTNCTYTQSHSLSPGSSPLFTLTESDNSTVITILIGEIDSNRIKFLTQLATTVSSTFISITRYAISDMNSNKITPILTNSPLQVFAFYPDDLSPVLREFSLDMDLRILSLTFDETVDIYSINTALIILQHKSLSTLSLSLPTSYLTVGQTHSTVVSITISDQDFNSLTAQTRLVTSRDDSYIRLLFNAIRDMNENPIEEILNGNAILVSQYTPDTSNPSLLSFSIDMDALFLYLTFSETMNTSSLNITTISLHQGLSPSGQSFTLTSSPLTETRFSEIVFIYFSREDANEIKRLRQLAQSQNSTYLSLTSVTITDMNSNPVNPNYLITYSYTPDSSPPIPENFVLDLTDETINLYFDETVRASSIDGTKFTVQSSNDLSSPSLVQYSLQYPLVILTNDSTFLSARIDVRDLNQLKLRLDLATNSSNTFLAFQYNALVDMALSPNSIVGGLIVQSSSVIPDTISPNLIQFEVDMNSGALTLVFDEPVNISSIYIPGLTVQNAARSRTGLQLSNSSIISPSNGVSIMIRLSDTELNEVKRIDSLFTFLFNSYISISSTFLTDLNGNQVVSRLNGFALRATRYFPDVQRPSIITYSINMNNGSILLYFSETVNISSVRCSDISISQRQYCNNTYTLSDCVIDTSNATYNSQDIGTAGDIPGGYGNATKWNTTFFYSTTLYFYFTLSDLNNLKSLRIAADLTSSYLHYKRSTILDQSDLSLLEINCTSPGLFPHGGFVPDSTRPSLTTFTLSLTTGRLNLSFSETVDGSRLTEIELTFVNGRDNSSSLFQYYTLSQVSHSTNLSPYLTVNISTYDLNKIKERELLATDTSNTFVTINNGFITDTLGYPINAITVYSALQASDVMSDLISPRLVSYDLDMNTGTFRFTFDETVNSTSLNPTQLWLQSSANATFSYNIISGNQSLPYSTVVSLTVSENDLNSIKNLTTIATSKSNTFIYISSNFISDMNDNPVIAIIYSNAKQVNTFKFDSESPTLLRFSVDLSTEILSLTFSETINSSSLNPQAITLRSQPAPGLVYILTGGNRTTFYNSLVVNFKLLTYDLNFVKEETSLFTNISDSFITYDYNLIQDLNENSIVSNSIGLQADSFYGDFVRPNLISFTLDIDSNYLILDFDETVNVNSLSISQITIQSHNNSGDVWMLQKGFLPLYSAPFLDMNSTVVVIELGFLDLNAIKLLTNLAVSSQTTFLSFTPQLITDMNHNYINPIDTTRALPVSSFTPDRYSPVLQLFDLDLDSEILTLQFSEVVNASSLICQELSLSNTPSLPTNSISLYNCSTQLINDYIIYIDLGIDFLNEIKLDTTIATSKSNTFIHFPNYVVTDMNRNFVTEFLIAASLQVRNFTQDSTPPTLLRFDLDLDTGAFILYFSESMDASYVDPTQLLISSSSISSNYSSSYQLTGGVVQSQDSNVINFNLTKSDLDAIKLIRELATSTTDTYLLFNVNNNTTFAVDMNLNPIDGGSGLPVYYFTEDTTSPIIVYTHLDYNTAVLTFLFTEPVDVITLQINNDNINFFDQSTSTSTPPLYSLVDGSSNSSDGLVISISLSPLDFNQLNFILRYGYYPTHLYLPELVRDMNGNLLTQTFNGSNITRLIDQFTPDRVNPSVISYNIDLNTGLLAVTFSELVRDILPIHFTLLNNNQSYNLLTSSLLTGPVIQGPGHPPEVTIHLSTIDLNEIKALNQLAISNSTTFLSVSNQAARDKTGNLITPVSLLSPLIYIPDSTNPHLVSSTFNLNNGLLALTFDESISANSLQYTQISLQSSFQAPEATYTLQFPNSSQVYFDGTTKLFITISENDLNEIKIISILFTEISNSFILLTPSSIQDTFSNPLNVSNLPIMVTLFSPDVTRPSLDNFDLDMNTNTLTLYLSESVNTSSLNVSRITLQSYYFVTIYNITSQQYTLQSAVTTSPNGPIIIIDLGYTDMNEIKRLTLIATRSENTYLSLRAQTVLDMSGLQINPIANGEAQPVRIFVPDSTNPSLVDFQFDFNIGLLQLTFDETIDISSFDPTTITFYNPTYTYTLQQGDLSNVTQDSTSLAFYLEKFDLDNLKIRSSLLSVNSITNLRLDEGTVLDLSYSQLPSNLDIRTSITFVADTTNPRLIS